MNRTTILSLAIALAASVIGVGCEKRDATAPTTPGTTTTPSTAMPPASAASQ